MKQEDMLLSESIEGVAVLRNADGSNSLYREQSESAPAPTYSPSKLSPRLDLWQKAIRPRTLTIALTPVIVGTMLAGLEVMHIAWDAVGMALVVSILIQIGTNLHNDVADFERGGDQPDRMGPVRVTAAGLLNAHEVHKAAMVCFAMATVGGGYLVWLGGWPILLLGVLSLIAGYHYSGGSRPIAYSPLGEVFVFLFFGLGAVAGSYYLQTQTVSLAAVLAGSIVGLQAAAVLMVNNYRDQQADAAIGRRTLAICVGQFLSRWIYALLMIAPFVILLPLQAALPTVYYLTVPLLSAPLVAYSILKFWRAPPGPDFNILLGRTAQAQALFAALLCIGLYI
jgi:1,4-dihydroxy-2-naphthoate polyprenyltransferase